MSAGCRRQAFHRDAPENAMRRRGVRPAPCRDDRLLQDAILIALRAANWTEPGSSAAAEAWAWDRARALAEEQGGPMALPKRPGRMRKDARQSASSKESWPRDVLVARLGEAPQPQASQLQDGWWPLPEDAQRQDLAAMAQKLADEREAADAVPWELTASARSPAARPRPVAPRASRQQVQPAQRALRALPDALQEAARQQALQPDALSQRQPSPASLLPQQLLLRRGRGNACGRVRRDRGRVNSSESSFR